MLVEEDERTLGGWPPKGASITLLLFLQQSFLERSELLCAEVPSRIFLSDFLIQFSRVLELGKALLFIGFW